MSRTTFLTLRAGVVVVTAALVGFIAGAGTMGRLDAQAPAAQSAASGARTTWFFYTVKWGHQDEFLDLFQATFRAEEQRRFEILDAHWDVPLNEIDLETRRPVGR